MLLPTQGALLPHIICANYITMRYKSYKRNNPDIPVIEGNGWIVKHDAYIPVVSNPPAPRAVLDLTKCGCKSGCNGLRCGCYKNGIPCTPLCKCYVAYCASLFRSEKCEDADLDDWLVNLYALLTGFKYQEFEGVYSLAGPALYEPSSSSFNSSCSSTSCFAEVLFVEKES